MASRAYAVLAKTCAELDDAVIDESVVDAQSGENYHRMERTVHVRGKRGAHPVSITYWDAYRPHLSRISLQRVELEMLEVFVADERMPIEATCRRKRMLDGIGRWFGRGGWSSRSPSLRSLRIDVHEGRAEEALEEPSVAEALAASTLRPDVSRLQLQRGTGVNLICHFGRSTSARSIVELTDEMCDVLERFARRGTGSPFRRGSA